METQNATRFVLEGQRLVETLDTADGLRAAALRVVTASERTGVTVLIAASAPGERLLGAALVLANGKLRGWAPGDRQVVLLDVALSSGASLASAAARVRALGAKRVAACVLANLGGHNAVPGVDLLVDLAKASSVEPRRKLAAV